MKEYTDEALKKRVGQYWDAHPCGTQFTDLVPGSAEFFENVEAFRRWSQPYMDRIFNFSAFKGQSVLEIGCGLGTDLIQFGRAGAAVTGVDLTPTSVALTEKRFALEGLTGTFMTADAERLPFEDGTFDAVYSFGVLHHTPNTLQAVHEAQRVLRPGGTLMLMLYHRRSIHVWLGMVMNALTRQFAVKDGSVDEWIRVFDGPDNPLGKAYTRQEVRSMLPQLDRIRFTVCDPMRRRYPGWLNAVNQKLFAGMFGFYLVMIGRKRERV